ncbi:MAG: Flp pilus assembly protein CpaB [Acidimicrobiales bacterium]
MAKRSNLLLVIGLAVFVLGAATTYLLVRDDSSAPAPGSGRSAVLVAAKEIPAGTSGSEAVESGLVQTRSVVDTARPATALSDSSQLIGRIAVLGVPAGAVLTSEQFAQAQTRIGTLRIPDGKTALALSLDQAPGVGGFAGAGDRINVYGMVKASVEAKGLPAVHLVLQNVEVLNVNGTAVATNPGAASGQLMYLVAVSPAEAERLIFLTTFEKLYFSLVASDQAPVASTPGATLNDALRLIA